jgi:toxin ParE1/3/4
MPSFLLRPKAREDLEGIWSFTLGSWGEDQADSYIQDLNKAFISLAQSPKKGRACEEIRKGYRKYLIGKHIIFYKLKGNDIEIVRVLHQNRDVDNFF